MPRLAFGSSYGREQKRRQVPGILFTRRSFPRRLTTPLHAHENAFFYMVVEGACREDYDRKYRIGTPSMVILSPEGQPHADAWFEGGGATFTVELAPEFLKRVREHAPVLRTAILRLHPFRSKTSHYPPVMPIKVTSRPHSGVTPG